MLRLKDNTLGNIGNPESRRPHVPDVMVAETKAAFHATVGVLAALLARRKSGEGQYVEVSLLDGVVSQKAAKPMTDLKKAANGFQVYETKDQKFLVAAPIEPWTWKNFVRALGKDDLADLSLESEHEHAEALKILRATFKSKTRKEWLDLFQDIDTELSPVNMPEEAVFDPQMVEREIFEEVESPDGKKSIQYTTPMKFSALPLKIRRAAPALGQDTDAVLSQMDLTKKR
jgi:crotonobetainyl-CoA:carnitine CoA-transferase CaiB-like acyl-CoA transferase